jgi:hypothetical protein
LVIPYKKAMKYFTGIEDEQFNVFPCIYPNWDHTPRSGKDGLVYHNSTPYLFKKHVNQILNEISGKPNELKIIFLKSWNEWAEGNYLEPDIKFGLSYLEALRDALNKKDNKS